MNEKKEKPRVIPSITITSPQSNGDWLLYPWPPASQGDDSERVVWHYYADVQGTFNGEGTMNSQVIYNDAVITTGRDPNATCLIRVLFNKYMTGFQQALNHTVTLRVFSLLNGQLEAECSVSVVLKLAAERAPKKA